MNHTYRCPECGCTTLDISVNQSARVRFDDDGEHTVDDIAGDAEWDSQSDTQCTKCGHSTVLRGFQVELEDDE